MSRVCPHCGYRQQDYEEPVVKGKIQCRKCREILAVPAKEKNGRSRRDTQRENI